MESGIAGIGRFEPLEPAEAKPVVGKAVVAHAKLKLAVSLGWDYRLHRYQSRSQVTWDRQFRNRLGRVEWTQWGRIELHLNALVAKTGSDSLLDVRESHVAV